VDVAVTGAAGGIGRWVVRELRQAGHRVLPLDRRPSGEVEGLAVLDLADAEATVAALKGMDAVVHLAAIPGPRPPAWSTFDPNVVTTYHVLEAVREHGIGRVVLASSIWAYGYNPPARERLPQRLPLQEDAVVPTVNCYGLSKRLLEHLGREYAAVTGCQVVCMRYPWVVQPERYPRRDAPPPERPGGPFCDDADLTMRAELWSYVDVRDVALACRLAVEREGVGFAVLNIGAADTRSTTPSQELVRRYAPEAELVRPVHGHEALYAIDRARALLGYEPRYSWRTAG
jgi:nucleoside-diphosphate-sugar epimerase